MPSFFARLFNRKPQQQIARLEVTGAPATFTAFSSDPWANDLFRAGVDSIARIFAKSLLTPVIEFSDGTKATADDHLTRLLQLRPNPLMSAYDLLYVLTCHLFTRNNSYCYLQREGGQIVALWPLHVTSCEIVTGANGEALAAMTFANGKTSILPYRDIVHLRRHFNSRDVLGDANDAIATAVNLADAQNAGARRAIEQQVRGLVKYAGSLAPSKQESYQQHFDETQLTGNKTGIILLPTGVDFTPLEPLPVINAQDREETKKAIWSYLGINESIVDSSFSDDQFGAFDESVIEALALQFSLEFTSKVYTPLQVARGRRIECSTQRIRFIGTAHRNELVTKILPMGILSINEGRDILGLQPIEGGDRYIQTLNVADVEIVNDLQTFRQWVNARKDGTLPAQLTEESPDDNEENPGEGTEDV